MWVPVEIAGVVGATDLALGYGASCALGSDKGWASAVLPQVMRVEPGGRRHFLDVQVGANNQLMVGVCRTRFDPVHGDNQLMSGVGGTGYLGAAFGENGWACKCIEPP